MSKVKKSLKVKLILLTVVAAISIYISIAPKELHSSTVNEVSFKSCVDGDTAKFTIDGEQQTVRFLAIDTPETVKPNTPVQPFGKEASEYTCSSLKSAKSIRLEYEDSNGTEKYGRKLAWVFIDDSLLQQDLITKGFAKVAYLYGDYKYTNDLLAAERTAKDSKVGIWK